MNLDWTAILQIFLYFDVFVMGLLAAVAIGNIFEHFRPTESRDKPKVSLKQDGHLPPEMRERMLETAWTRFDKVLDRSSVELEKDLLNTSMHMNKRLDKLAEDIISTEMKRYHQQLVDLRKHADAVAKTSQASLGKQQAELKEKLDEEVAAEKQRLLQQINVKLGDAVASFLTETLQHNIDLGAQTNYMISMLEENKAAFVKEVSDEA